MNQEEIGKIIKKIRKDNHLSQQDFANKYGVTFQAVSKWENGRNIPDIEIIKKICNDYHLDINQFLDAKKIKQKNYLWIILSVLLLSVIVLIIIVVASPSSFEFKTITSSCNDFTVTGSMAYNDKKSSIYISHVDYCGGDDNIEYKSIECDLMEENNNSMNLIEKCAFLGENETLEQFLKNVKFNVDKSDKSCTRYAQNPLYLVITAVKEDGTVNDYSIPLKLSDNCE